MTTTLITGANKGMGFETARQLTSAGHTVYLGSRDLELGRQAAAQIGARAVQLDVTDDASVTAAADLVAAEGHLDVLVNNAGIAPEWRADSPLVGAAEVTAELMEQTFATNVTGAVRVLHAFLPLLMRSQSPVVVNVSSGLASFGRATSPGQPGYDSPLVAYPASKTALNMVTVQFAKAFPQMRINAVEPGFTATDLNGGTGHQNVEQGAETIATMAQLDSAGPTGGYFSATGHLAW